MKQSGRAARAFGFTLVELLVVIAIIGVLAALIFPSLSQAKRKTYQANCLSNLRQVGAALQMWVDDNNDWLPPGGGTTYGLFTGQHPDYAEEVVPDRYRYQLAYYLAGHLGYPAPDAQVRNAKVFFCTGFERYAPGVTNIAGRVCYGVTSTNYFKDDSGRPKLSFNPFGYPPGMQRTPEARPSKVSTIAAERSPAEVYSLVDLDKVAIGFGSTGASWRNQLPNKPVHGRVRNYLYFDQHVATEKVKRNGVL